MAPILLYPMVVVCGYGFIKLLERWIKGLVKDALAEAICDTQDSIDLQQQNAILPEELIAHLGTLGHFTIKH